MLDGMAVIKVSTPRAVERLDGLIENSAFDEKQLQRFKFLRSRITGNYKHWKKQAIRRALILTVACVGTAIMSFGLAYYIRNMR